MKIRSIIVVLSIFIGTTLFAQWTIEIKSDIMTEEMSAYASSSMITSVEKMKFPYSDIKSWIGVGCDKKYTWAYLGFTTAPNISDKIINNRYDTFFSRIKFDENLEKVRMTQDWGSNFIHFRDKSKIIEFFKKSNSVLLELNWYGEGRVYFKYPMDGSTEAINEVLKKCSEL